MSTQLLEKTGEIAEKIGFAPRLKRWTNAQFEQMIAAGLFDSTRAELIDGEILEMSPMLEPHALALMKTQDECYRVFSLREFGIRNQSPFFVGEGYRPEPDLVVVRRSTLSAAAPPSSAVLVVEISDSTLSFDRADKASLYASVGIADYWIVNVGERVLEVRREPRLDSTARFGFSYGSLQTLDENASIAPLGAPQSAISVAGLF